MKEKWTELKEKLGISIQSYQEIIIPSLSVIVKQLDEK